jgi:hypothetical protein
LAATKNAYVEFNSETECYFDRRKFRKLYYNSVSEIIWPWKLVELLIYRWIKHGSGI